MQETKKGGPYNKTEQDSRRNEVSKLHFEYGYSARRIANMMKINRNTINEDIKHLYSNIKVEFKGNDEDFILKQIGRLEAQRSRITETLREGNTEEKIKYERLLLEIDSKLNNFLTKVHLESREEYDKNKDEEIRDFVLFLLIKYSKNPSITKEDMVSEIVNIRQCAISQAENIFLQIDELGLECCKKFDNHDFVYNLLEFAYLRRYLLPTDPFVTKIHGLCIIHNDFDTKKHELKEKFKEKHGDEEKWEEEIFVEYRQKQEKLTKEHAENSSKIIVELLGELSDQKEIKKYLHCVNVFFGEEEKTMLEKIFE